MALYKTTFRDWLLLTLLLQCFVASYGYAPIVSTTIGQIRGLEAEDGDYYMYMGIPYAKVDRSNPFGNAVPQEPFDEVFDAFDDSTICTQIEEFNHTVVGTLDCLDLNIYTPTSATPEDPKPVMVLIFGGGFSIGFAGRFLYGPEYLVRHDVLFVTLNYRLGAYGFACLDIPEIPGNQGLKDTTMALRWIKENIQLFGGDPDKITVFGNSAGAMAIDFHLVSQQEKLFNQAILQSGSSLLPGFAGPNKDALFQLAAYLGLATNNIYEAIAYLAGIDEHLIISATAALSLSFNVCVEKEFNGVESFLTEDWIRAPIPKVHEMPILLGNANSEMLALVNLPPETFDNFNIIGSLGGDFEIADPDFEGMDRLVSRFYMGDANITRDDVLVVLEMLSDFSFMHPMFRSIEKYLENGAGDIFYYVFSYVGDRNFVRIKDSITVEGGAAHADELGYLFDGSYFQPPNPEDQLFIDRLTTLWTNFAKFGNPTPQPSELVPVLWRPVTNDSFHHLNLDSELTAGRRPFYRRMTFWDLFYKANADLIQKLT